LGMVRQGWSEGVSEGDNLHNDKDLIERCVSLISDLLLFLHNTRCFLVKEF